MECNTIEDLFLEIVLASDENENSKIVRVDPPDHLSIGFVVYWTENKKEISRNFEITRSTLIRQNKSNLFDTDNIFDNNSINNIITDKKKLKKIINLLDEERKRILNKSW